MASFTISKSHPSFLLYVVRLSQNTWTSLVNKHYKKGEGDDFSPGQKTPSQKNENKIKLE